MEKPQPRRNSFERGWRTITVTADQKRILAERASQSGFSSISTYLIYVTGQLKGPNGRGLLP